MEFVRDGAFAPVWVNDRVAFISEGMARVGTVLGFTSQRVKVRRHYLMGSKTVYLKPKNILKVCPYTKVTM